MKRKHKELIDKYRIKEKEWVHTNPEQVDLYLLSSCKIRLCLILNHTPWIYKHRIRHIRREFSLYTSSRKKKQIKAVIDKETREILIRIGVMDDQQVSFIPEANIVFTYEI